MRNFCNRTRREFLWQVGGGFGSVALAGMLGDSFFQNQAVAADGRTPFLNPLAPKRPHFAPKAKSVIFLFMYGGPSQIDTFDYKPTMKGRDNQTVTVRTFGRGGHRNSGRIVEPRWSFRQYGQCGKWVSDLFPHLSRHVDDIAFLHSMTADSPIHGSAMLMMNSGKILSGFPCLGSWVNYGLGSENENLPGFVVMLDPRGGPISGAKNWSSGYMPAYYEGTLFRGSGAPILDLARPRGMSEAQQRQLLDTLRAYNDDHAALRPDNSALAARIASYELAYRMQAAALEVGGVDSEPAHIRSLYGLDHADKRTRSFARKCLLARRLVERGVRFVQVYDMPDKDGWDAHAKLTDNHVPRARWTDQPSAGLIADLAQRGLLEETLIIWASEFGRTPMMQGDLGRQHGER